MDDKRTLLERCTTPAELKKLPRSALPQLAQEMRNYLIETLAPIGGHLGAGLGVVEITIALHYLFDSPCDKLIWDVGHQSYPHKILTGRLAQMPTIRQKGGLCGFTNRFESEHDAFGAGHASTSLSAALGMALSRDLQQQHYHTVAIIGDGALTGGMAFEALNHAGACQDSRLLVILNDNEMSISPNVGAMSAYLSRVISGKTYTHARDVTKRILEKLPRALDAAKRIEEHLKGMITPGTLFEEMGFVYIGPIDGHNFDHLLPTIENCKALNRPVLLHVITKKGLGFSPAEDDPETWHGLGPYNPATGLPNPSHAQTFTQVFGDTLAELADSDPTIIAITAAMGTGTGVSRFAKRHPDRTYDVGIAEQHATTFAAGMAATGLKPVVAIYATFMQRAYDQVIHDVCIQQLPVLFCLDRAGIVGADGATHTGMFDIASMRIIPNLIFMAPKDGDELRHMLRLALTLNAPTAIRYPRGEAIDSHRATTPLELGKSEVIKTGRDGLLITLGTRFQDAERALERFESESNQSFAFINLRFIKPLDSDTILTHLVHNKPLIVVEEGVREGGIGEAIAALALKYGWSGRFHHLAMPDIFPEHGTQAEILHDLALDEAAIYRTLIS
ncbi:MAG: 1-deoxy-D-xylulose-5-phosphate synthase [Zetaproteobacteria bacterium]|nr:1-deoxy-D-xylulose-5-phosphate synthase [Zetaproteobacteria bacterium]